MVQHILKVTERLGLTLPPTFKFRIRVSTLVTFFLFGIILREGFTYLRKVGRVCALTTG